MADPNPQKTIAHICKGIGGYYKDLGKPYEKLFTKFCVKEGFDDLEYELDDDPNECSLVGFDPNFPFKEEPSKESNKNKFIFHLIAKCYADAKNALRDLILAEIAKQFNEQAVLKISSFLDDNFDNDPGLIWEDVIEEDGILKEDLPSRQFRCIERVCTKYCEIDQDVDITNLQRNYTHWKLKTQQTRKLFHSQCPGLFAMNDDIILVDAVTLGRDNNLPLALYIADTFSRYRIHIFCYTNYQKDVSTEDFTKTLPFYQSMEKSNNKGTAIRAILRTYHKRFVPKLEFDPKIKINDNIEDIVRYISAAAQMIDSTLMHFHDVMPFQFDLLIIPKHRNSNANINDEYDAVLTVDSDDDDSDPDTDDDDDNRPWHASFSKLKNRDCDEDQIGFIEPRLKKYKIKYVSFDIEERSLKRNAYIKRTFNDNFWKIRKGRNGRYVMIVDRRDKWQIHYDYKKQESDKIYIYSPSCQDDEKNTANTFDKIHQDYLDESLLFKTKKCCIPGVTEAMDTHLGADCTGFLTLSFHVLDVDLIRCYLYVNGWGSRFQPIDLIKLLPIYFVKKAPSKSNILNEDKLNTLFPLKLKDEKFDSWYAGTTKK